MIRKAADLKKLMDENAGFITTHYPFVTFHTEDGKSYRVAQNAFTALRRSGYLTTSVKVYSPSYKLLTYIKKVYIATLTQVTA